MNDPTPEDIAAMRDDGSLMDYLKYLTSQAPRPDAKPAKPALAAVPDPGYLIAHVGGWPLGTAASGPTPPPQRAHVHRSGGGNPSNHTHREDAA